MEEKLNNILISLANEKMYDDKNAILDVLELLNEEFNNIKKNLKKQMKNYIDEEKIDNIDNLRKVFKQISEIQIEIEHFSTFKTDKSYPNSIEIKETEKTLERLNEIKLDSDLSYTKPYKIRIKEETYDLPRNTWTDLLEITCDIFAGKDKTKFLQFTKKFNDRKLQGIKFLESNINNDKKIYHIKPANIYLQRGADANTLGSVVFDLLKYFNCDNNYGIYVLDNREEKQSPKNKNSININSKVKHTKYGIGRIISIDNNYITIVFDSEKESKKFPLSSMNKELFEII